MSIDRSNLSDMVYAAAFESRATHPFDAEANDPTTGHEPGPGPADASGERCRLGEN